MMDVILIRADGRRENYGTFVSRKAFDQLYSEVLDMQPGDKFEITIERPSL